LLNLFILLVVRALLNLSHLLCEKALVLVGSGATDGR